MCRRCRCRPSAGLRDGIAGAFRRRAPVHRARREGPAELRGHQRQRSARRPDLPGPRRHPARHRAGRRARARHVGRAHRRRARRPLPPADRRRARCAAAVADAASVGRLEPRRCSTSPNARCCVDSACSTGGFTLDACESVCAGDELDRYAVLDLLTSLVDKSLVLVEERESLEPLRVARDDSSVRARPARRGRRDRPAARSSRRRVPRSRRKHGTDPGDGRRARSTRWAPTRRTCHAAIDHTAPDRARQVAAPLRGAGLLVAAHRAARGGARGADSGAGRDGRPAIRVALRRTVLARLSRVLRGRLRAHAARRDRGARARTASSATGRTRRASSTRSGSSKPGRIHVGRCRRSSAPASWPRRWATPGASPRRRRTSAGRCC